MKNGNNSIISIICIYMILLSSLSFSSCGANANENPSKNGNDVINIVLIGATGFVELLLLLLLIFKGIYCLF